LLPWLRFYVPILILASIGIWTVLQRASWKKWLVVFGAIGAMAWLISRYTIPTGVLQLSPAGALLGAVRFVLTPQPWSVDPGYSFLVLPALLNWVLLPVSALGAVLLMRESREAALPLIYLLVAIGFYA